MSFLNTEKKNAAWETKGYMEMEKKKKVLGTWESSYGGLGEIQTKQVLER